MHTVVSESAQERSKRCTAQEPLPSLNVFCLLLLSCCDGPEVAVQQGPARSITLALWQVCLSRKKSQRYLYPLLQSHSPPALPIALSGCSSGSETPGSLSCSTSTFSCWPGNFSPLLTLLSSFHCSLLLLCSPLLNALWCAVSPPALAVCLFLSALVFFSVSFCAQ